MTAPARLLALFLLAMLILGTLMLVSGMAFFGSFSPTHAGPTLIRFVDAQDAPIRCLGLALEIGDVVGAALGLIAPYAACTAQNTIIAPISPGVGQVIGLLAGAGPDAVLGHELAHVFRGHFHPAGLPF